MKSSSPKNVIDEYVDKFETKHPNIMVIDDSSEMLGLLDKYMESGGIHDHHSFLDEFTAMSYLSDTNVDLMVIDINLEHFNGFKLGEILRDISKSEVPIIYISSNNEYLKDFYKSDQRNTYFMQKPFNKQTFCEVVAKMLNISRNKAA